MSVFYGSYHGLWCMISLALTFLSELSVLLSDREATVLLSAVVGPVEIS